MTLRNATAPERVSLSSAVRGVKSTRNSTDTHMERCGNVPMSETIAQHFGGILAVRT